MEHPRPEYPNDKYSYPGDPDFDRTANDNQLSNDHSPGSLRLFSEDQFELVKRLCEAPSPIGFEGAMIDGVIIPELKSFMPDTWELNRFTGNPGLVVDTHPHVNEDNLLSVMVVGHADKIRLQVKSISEDGKIYVQTQSFLPAAIVGHRFDLVIEDPDAEGNYRLLRNLTAQAFGAIHFADKEVRSGDKGVKPNQIYLETGLFGENRKERLEEIGVRPGQPVIFSRGINRGPTKGTFYGSYLDNALGCFSVLELARRLADFEERHGELMGVRALLTFATHEEIGRFGSRIIAGEYKPDILIAVDVNHDFEAAPGIGDRNMQPLAMGEGCTITDGTVHSHPLTSFARAIANKKNIPYQRDFGGYDSGTDSMASALSGVDSASFSIGFPIRNMHTSSELAYDGDVLAAIDLLEGLMVHTGRDIFTADTLKSLHTVLSRSKIVDSIEPDLDQEE